MAMARLRGVTLAFIESHPGEAARVLENLPPAEVAAVVAAIPGRVAAPLLARMFPAHAARTLAQMPDDPVAHLLRRLGARASASVLRHLPAARRGALIEQLPAAMAAAVRLLLRYPEDSVGALADVEVVVLTGQMTVREALAQLKAAAADTGDFLYVVDPEQRLIGCLRPATLLHATGTATIGELVQRGIPRLSARATAASVRDHDGWSAYSTLPVVELGGRFVGALRQVVLMRALAPAPEDVPTEPATSVLESFAGAYWFALSGLLAAAVNWLPVKSTTEHRP